MPVMEQTAPSTFNVPISIGETDRYAVVRFEFAVRYDPAVMGPAGANFGCSTAGTLVENSGFTVVCNSAPDGSLRVSAFGTQPMTAAGAALDLTFTTDANASTGGYSALQFESVAFFSSTGNIAVVSQDGSVTVTAVAATPTPTPAIEPSPTATPTPVAVSSPTPTIFSTPTPSPVPTGLESDVDESLGVIAGGDVSRLRLFVAGVIDPAIENYEFQRADAAPAVSKGDGYLDVADIVQARRYALGTDMPSSMGGPIAPFPSRPVTTFAPGETPVVIGLGSTDADAGSQVTIPIEMIRRGDEVAASFTLNFDPSRLANPTLELGSGTEASETILTVNRRRVASGQLGIVLDSERPFTGKELASVTFDVIVDSPSGDSVISFSDNFVAQSTADDLGERLPTSYENGAIYIRSANTPTMSISGHVLTSDGPGLRNATVKLVDDRGTVQSVKTSSFGMYVFVGLFEGRMYTVGVVSKRFRFAPRSVQALAGLTAIDFVATE